MSQFKARQLWSTRVSEGSEQFDTSLLCVCRADDQNTGDKLVVASMEGVLRMYLPRVEAFSPGHLVVERDLGEPVVQIASGRVVSGSALNHLIVLHPRRLTVYSLSQVSGLKKVEQGGTANLPQVYQHVLKRTAVNMCVGAFGGVQNREFICVQSLDGVLSVFEQDLFAFSRFLPNVLLPGPLCYCRAVDCLLTVSSSRMLTCYRYTGIAMASGAEARESSKAGQHLAQPASGKRLSPDWSMDIGEHVREISVEESPGEETRIMVLGQRSLFCVSLDGKIQFAKKLESRPSCFKPYAVKKMRPSAAGETDSIQRTMTMVAFDRHHTLAILEDTRLAWAASLPAGSAVALDVMQIANTDSLSVTRGVIVTLEDDGRLACLFLGTEPLEGPQDAMSARRQEDFKRHEEDLRSLRSFIKATEENKNKDELHKMVCTDLDMHGKVVLSTETPSKEMLSADAEQAVPQKCAVLTITLKAPQKQAVHDVAITVRCQAPVMVDPPGIVVSHVTPDNPSTLRFCFFVIGNQLVCNNTAVVVASFTSATGYPNMMSQTFQLPLALFVESVPPEKEAQCKITVDTNQPCVSLQELFSDVPQSVDLAQNSVAFQLSTGQTISVLSSRSSQRYRIQCNDFPSIWLVLTELVDRLYQHYAEMPDTSGESFNIALKETLPLAEYYMVMDEHLHCRIKLEECRQHLDKRAVEFRILQKRLLLRIKDKTPTPLQHLDMLHSRSYDLLMMLCNEEESLRAQLQEAARQLSASTRAITLLIRLYAGLANDQMELLQAILSPIVPEPMEFLGWEETTDTALMQMLRTCLSLSDREQDIVIPAMGMPESNSRLKKHLSLFIVRLAKEGLVLNADGEPSSRDSRKKLEKTLSKS